MGRYVIILHLLLALLLSVNICKANKAFIDKSIETADIIKVKIGNKENVYYRKYKNKLYFQNNNLTYIFLHRVKGGYIGNIYDGKSYYELYPSKNENVSYFVDLSSAVFLPLRTINTTKHDEVEEEGEIRFNHNPHIINLVAFVSEDVENWLVEAEVEYANMVFRNSKVDVKVKLRNLYKIPIHTNIPLYTYLASLPTIKNAVIALFKRIEKGEKYCGIGYLRNSLYKIKNDDLAKVVINVYGYEREDGKLVWCPLDVLVHELGHLYGCEHDRRHSKGKGIFEYSYGYCNYCDGFGTVMSYCHPHIPYFSDMRVLEGMRLIGTWQNRNSLSLRKVFKLLEKKSGCVGN